MKEIRYTEQMQNSDQGQVVHHCKETHKADKAIVMRMDDVQEKYFDGRTHIGGSKEIQSSLFSGARTLDSIDSMFTCLHPGNH